MQPSLQAVSTPMAMNAAQMDHSLQPAYLVYQILTIAAMLLLLCSLWAF